MNNHRSLRTMAKLLALACILGLQNLSLLAGSVTALGDEEQPIAVYNMTLDLKTGKTEVRPVNTPAPKAKQSLADIVAPSIGEKASLPPTLRQDPVQEKEPMKTTFAVYGRITDWTPGTDRDGDSYYETYSFNIAIDADASPGPTTIYAKMICNTTGQAWWSASPWSVAGTPIDYEYFGFNETDFAGRVTGNRSLDFTVEIWNSIKTAKLATDTTVTGEPIRADYVPVPRYAVYGVIADWSPGADRDGDGFYESYSFKVGIDGDTAGSSATVYGRIVCNSTGQGWWSANPWTIAGIPTDYHFFQFSEADFAGRIRGNSNLNFTVSIWNLSKTTRLAADTTVIGQPIKADFWNMVEAPVFIPAPQAFASTITVQAFTETPGAVIRYTTNISNPTAYSPILPSAGLTLNRTTTLRIRAFKAGLNPSLTTIGTFTRGTAVATRRALLVGIDHYSPTYGASSLPSCINDATGFRNVTLLGDSQNRWPSQNITLLTDSQATKTTIRTSLQSLASTSVDGDVVVYYHSSHGGQISGSNVFLCSYNANYSDAELAADLARFSSGTKVIVVVDACHSGGLFKGSEWPFAENVTRYYQEIKTAELKAKGLPLPKVLGQNIAFMTACRYNETSSAGNPYSLYAGYLVTGCSQAATDSNSDHELSFLELHTYAAARTLANRSTQHAQSSNNSLLQSIVVRSAGARKDFAASQSAKQTGENFAGLFYEENGLSQNTSGCLKLSLAAGNAFTARLQLGTEAYAFSGQFTDEGLAGAVISRPGKSPLAISLALDYADPRACLLGSVGGDLWNATLVADATGSKNNPCQGAYQFSILDNANAPIASEMGRGLVRVDSSGNVTISATMKDGSSFSTSTTVSTDGYCPLYAPRHGGQSLLCWLKFDSNAPSIGFHGTLSWNDPMGAASGDSSGHLAVVGKRLQ